MKKWTKIVLLMLVVALVLSTAVAFGAAKYKKKTPWVVGFSQIGSESEWRTADTTSVKDAISGDSNMILVYADAQQKQENQIKALRTFIARKVDVIIFTALVETGYGPVLKEAQKAKIPVIMIDRDVAKEDQKYRLTIMGSDFVKEGQKCAAWLADNLKKMGVDDGKTPINFAELEGTVGSAAAVGRKQGFEAALKDHPNWQLKHDQTGNFTRAEGKQVMEAFLKADKKIQVLVAHNDDMALGAIQAIEEAGLKPGKDIIIISFDGVKGAFQAMIDGKLNAVVECNPLLGPQAVQAVYDYMEGKKLPAKIDTIEGVFDQTNAKAAFPTRQY